MRRDKLVSVIVPAYNLEKYIARCIDSILHQTYQNIELVIVNDGSTDQTYAICKQYEEQDHRIRLLSQDNQGAASARRNGIRNAQGEYICFVDGDDYIDTDMIAGLYGHIHEADMVTSGIHVVYGDDRDFDRTDSFEEGLYSSESEMRHLLTNMIVYDNRFQDGFLPFVMNKMYKKAILEQAAEEIDPRVTYGEDRDLLFRYILRCKSIYVTHESWYYYWQREGSAVHLRQDHFLSNLNYLYDSLYDAFSKEALSESLIHQLQMFMLSRLYDVPVWMKFAPDVRNIRYFLPMEYFKEKKKIILYGAGAVGLDYYRQLRNRPDCELVLWLDKNWENCANQFLPVRSVSEIDAAVYDHIVIAIKKPEVAAHVAEELVGRGVDKGKIIYKEPILIK
jgi:glycosyltransferase involved in cell wall biosynthesis